jgi:GxxExxY protein
MKPSNVGCATSVKWLGTWHEKPYENALVVEFGLSSVPFLQQPHYEVLYKGLKVGEYIPDLIAFGAIVVDAKVVEAITDHERGQMPNYLKITGLKLGVIPNLRFVSLRTDHPRKDRAIRQTASH